MNILVDLCKLCDGGYYYIVGKELDRLSKKGDDTMYRNEK